MGIECESLLRVERAVEVGLLVEVPRRPTHVVEHLREGSRCGVVALAQAHLVEGDGGAAVKECVATRLFHFVVNKAWVVVGMRHFDDVLLWLARNLEAVVGIGAIVAACIIATGYRVDNGTVGKHQSGFRTTNGVVGDVVIYMSPEVDLPFLGRHSEDCTDHYGQ